MTPSEKGQRADKPTCGKPRSRNQGPCGSTILGPNGWCRAHGGWSGAPKGNKNPLTHGGHETIFADALSPDESALFLAATVKTPLEQAKDEVALLTVRERRMMLRIKRLQDEASGMTAVEETSKALAVKGEWRKPDPPAKPRKKTDQSTEAA